MPEFSWNKIDKILIIKIVNHLKKRALDMRISNRKVSEEIKGLCSKMEEYLNEEENVTFTSHQSTLEKLVPYLLTSDIEKIREELLEGKLDLEITILRNVKSYYKFKNFIEQSKSSKLNELLLQLDQIEKHTKQLTEANIVLNKELALKANAEKTINTTNKVKEQQSSSIETENVEMKNLEEALKIDLSDEHFNWNQIKPKYLQVLAELKFNEFCQNRDVLMSDLETLNRDCLNQIEQQIALSNQIKILAEQAQTKTSIPADLQNQFNETLFPEDIEKWKIILSISKFETAIDFEAIKNYLIQQSKLNSCSTPKNSTMSLSDNDSEYDSEYDSDELLSDEERDASDYEIIDLTF